MAERGLEMATNMLDKDVYEIRIYHSGEISTEQVLAFHIEDAIRVAKKSKLLEQFTGAPEIVSVTRITNGDVWM